MGFSILILLPCAALTVLGLLQWRQNPFVPLTLPDDGLATSLGFGRSWRTAERT